MTQSRSRQPMLIRLALYALPGVMILFGALIFWDTWRFTRAALPAEGEIQSIRYVYKSRTESTTKRTIEAGDYFPTVRYQDQDGDWWLAELAEPVDFTPTDGQRFAILYHVENRGWVQQAHGFFTTWLVPLILAGLGGLGILAVRWVLQAMGRADAQRTAGGGAQ